MTVGHKLLITGFLLAITGFVLSYEYPKIFNGVIGGIITIGSLVIIVIGALILYKFS